MKRALTVNDLLSFKPTILEFRDEWLRSFGRPELSGSIIIYGMPKNGKTSFALRFCKYLTTFGRVLYNTVEEGKSLSFKLALERENIKEVSKSFNLLDRESSITDLIERLKMRRSADFVVIDSIQFAEMTFKEYKKLKETFRNKLFIFISHVDDRREPDGRVAKRIKRDSGLFIYIEGYRAFPQGRYGGGEPFDIWPEKAAQYWNKL